jgi:hypothetical protein
METVENIWASQSLDQGFKFIPTQACRKTAYHWIKRHFVGYDVETYVLYEISDLALTTMGLKELHICLLVIISLISFLKKQGCVGFPICVYVCVPHLFFKSTYTESILK